MIIYLLLVQLFYVVSSDPQNSKLYEDSLCQNCTLEVRLKHLELLVEKLLAMNSADPSVNWLNNFAFGLASAVTSFGFHLVVALLGMLYIFRMGLCPIQCCVSLLVHILIAGMTSESCCTAS